MIGVDLFAGAGGLSLGAAQAGVDVRLAVEQDPHAADTYVANHPNTKVHTGDVRDVDAIDIPANGDVRVLFGGPPCQGFSTSNQRTRTVDNEANWLFRHFMRLAKSWQPDWILLENVKGLRETEGGIFFREIVASLEGLGYTPSSWVLNAADYGVPQTRSRMFIIGSHAGIRLPAPPVVMRRRWRVTVRQAIGDLPGLTNGASVSRMAYHARPQNAYAKAMRGNLDECENHLVTRNAPLVLKRYRHVPPGGNWEDIPPRLMRNYQDRSRCHTGIYHRLRSDIPAVVIGNYRKNMLIHPYEDRGLSVREAARLQSFPDSYVFRGSIGLQQQQVGNAVPPLLARAVFQSVLGTSKGH
jgi:DNA (cytosine-5)-methyltransferase 1